MRILPKYITTLLVAGAAGAAIAGGPTAVAAPAWAHPAGIAAAPMDRHGGWGCGDHGGWGGGDHGGWGGGDHGGWGRGDHGGWGRGDHGGWGGGDYDGWQWWLPYWGR